MCSHLNAITFFHGRIANDMVNMAMCVDGQDRFQSMAVDEAEEFILFACRGTAWIDDDTRFAFLIVNDVCVFRKRVEDELFELEHDFNISAQR
jgi:hypothetical protein